LENDIQKNRNDEETSTSVEIYLALKVRKIRTRIIICYEEYHWVYMLEWLDRSIKSSRWFGPYLYSY